jgi:hypothetical protein
MEFRKFFEFLFLTLSIEFDGDLTKDVFFPKGHIALRFDLEFNLVAKWILFAYLLTGLTIMGMEGFEDQ